MKKTAIITGASGDIGMAISEEFAKHGYDLIMHYFSSKEKCEQFADGLQAKYASQLINI